jgi:PilZ domain
LTSQSQKRADRRWGVRIEVDLPVRLDLAQRSVPARMRNASVSGALIECPEEIPMFTPMRVEIPPDGDRIPVGVSLSARVVRAEHPYLGIEWREFEPAALLGLLKPKGH